MKKLIQILSALLVPACMAMAESPSNSVIMIDPVTLAITGPTNVAQWMTANGIYPANNPSNFLTSEPAFTNWAATNGDLKYVVVGATTLSNWFSIDAGSGITFGVVPASHAITVNLNPNSTNVFVGTNDPSYLSAITSIANGVVTDRIFYAISGSGQQLWDSSSNVVADWTLAYPFNAGRSLVGDWGTSNGDFHVGGWVPVVAKYTYWGKESTDGSWRMGLSTATSMVVQVRVLGAWVNASFSTSSMQFNQP